MLRARVQLRRLLAAPLACALILLSAGASRAQAAPCAQTVFDAGGYVFDLAGDRAGYASIRDGGSNDPAEVPPGPVQTFDAFDSWGGGFVLPSGAATPTLEDRYEGEREACTFALNGHEIGFPVLPIHGLEVQRRWYIDPGPLHGARALNLLRNPGTAPITVAIRQGDQNLSGGLGSEESTTVFATSDGTGRFAPNAQWGVTEDSGGTQTDEDPALAHVWDGPGGVVRASKVVLGEANSADTLYWEWTVTVPPAGTVSFISYEIQAAAPGRSAQTEGTQAVEQAEAREKQSPGSLYVGMSPAEIAGTMNWPRPAPTAAIAPVKEASSAVPVRLNGAGSIAAAGLPQCEIASYSWKADDGASGSGSTFSHVFTAGEHRATLTVISDCGGSASAERSFTVAPGLKRGGRLALKLGRVTLNRGIGNAALKVTALVPGKLVLAGAGVEKQMKRIKQAGTVSLIVRPIGKALRTLQRTRRAKVRVIVSLTPQGGGPPTRLSKAVGLKRVR